ncbi:uncharacterized protein [Nothobranchius furzeri]|uniref:Ankyrin repeat and LEM domain containing 1 n=2 Tax=Nothobranchius TaxID=28779 RepID=A0A1A8AFK3_NOTFU|nr:transcript variant X1 [Nothobranchius furzeri]
MDRNKRRLASQLCAAVNGGDPRSVQNLLSKGASPDLVGSKGVAAIHLAVGKETEKNIRCLKMLLQHGADPNVRSSEGLTPLHVAALWGCYQNLKLLLINGGDPNIKDNEGSTPGELAEQQENRKCAHLLEEYLSSSDGIEEAGVPRFQYSVYSDQTDVSSYPESNCSFSDFGEAPMSSTRLSLLSNLSSISRISNYKGSSFNSSTDASMLCSTRLSAVAKPLPNETLSCREGIFPTKANESTANGTVFPPELPSGRVRPKSVSFRNIDDIFPVFSPEQKQKITGEDSTLPFNLSEYSDFLDSERLVTVLPKQGLDVTSPDHAYVFCRGSSENTADNLDKTVVSHCASDGSDGELEGQNDKEHQVNADEQPALSQAASSSGTGSSDYSSCESDHYASCLEATVHSGRLLFPVVGEDSAGAESDRRTNQVLESSNDFPEEAKVDSKSETVEPLSRSLNNLNLSEEKHAKNGQFDCSSGSVTCKEETLEPEADVRSESEENAELSFTPGSFVTGRTRSRLSRCSTREGRTPESVFATSSLFEDTLPTPVRTLRHTPRSQSSGHCHSSRHTPSYGSEHLGGSRGGAYLPSESQDSQSSTCGSSSSQLDTLILPKNVPGSVEESQTLNDTIILEKNPDYSVDAYEKNLAEIILAMRGQDKGLSGDGEFLTDDLTSADDAAANENVASAKEHTSDLINEDLWMSERSTSLSESASSSSSSSYFSPRRSRENSDPACTPGTGCTPRYSMSKLLSNHRPQRPADLSFTPGGRPLIQDLDEPVEYLYTDTEQGHKLIETHVPPTADTTSSGEETVFYDWACLQAEIKGSREKENQQSERVAQEEKNKNPGDGLLPEIRGITDKELRLRLVELGESPGPISSRTRPTYMKRLRRLLQESNLLKKQLDQPQIADLGYTPELRLVLQTFQLPDSHNDEQVLSQEFDQPDQNRKWREGLIKSSFNYLLLDPRVTKNLPFRSHSMSPHECFQSFIHAIFYVGKGKRSRPYSHLYEALEYYTGDKMAKKLFPKVKHILQVWSAGHGVISLHCFQNVIPVEAYTREACMVEAIGLKMLTNQKRGDFYGVVSHWDLKRKRKLGVHLLYRAMQIFLAEGERQLRPADIRV